MMCDDSHMAKRGEKLNWKVRFEYENGVKGLRAHYSEWEANHMADQIRRNAEGREMAVMVEVFEVAQ